MPPKHLALALFLGYSTFAPGAIMIQNIGDDAAFNSYLQALGVNVPADYSRELYAAEGRFGNNSTSTAQREIGFHWNNPADATPPTSSAPLAGTGSLQHVWGAASADALINNLVDFSLSRVGNTVSFTFGPGGTFYSASLTDPKASLVNFIAIRSRAQSTATTTAARVRIVDLVLNGLAIGSTGAFETGSTDGTPVTTNFAITGLTGDFTLTGRTALDWTGANPGSSALTWQIKNFESIPETPEPGSGVMLAGALLGGATSCVISMRRGNARLRR